MEMNIKNKHKRREDQKHDGKRPEERNGRINAKTPPRYENFDGEPIE
jgi:hypothetical protein